MKLVKSVLFSLALVNSALAFAGGVDIGSVNLSNKSLFTTVATVVVAQGEGSRVEGCSQTSTVEDLITCVSANANLRVADFVKVKKGELLKGEIEISFYDDSGDCLLTANVDADTAKVISLSDWSCR